MSDPTRWNPWPRFQLFARVCPAIALMTCVQVAEADLQITEIMFNPSSPDDAVWEWIEVCNTGSTDFDFDSLMDLIDGCWMKKMGDSEPAPDAAPNIHNVLNGGNAQNTVIPAGGVGILYDAHVNNEIANYNDQLFRDAWGLDTNVSVIAVDFWRGLSNYGNHV